MSDEQAKRNAMNDIRRSDRANELLNNPLYIEAISSMELALYESFKDTKLSNESERHELWQRMQLLKQFKGKFEHIVKKGEKAKETLSLLDRAKKMVRI